MKLIIDIPDKVWDIAKEYGHLDICGIELSERVMNGTPYEERPQGEWIMIKNSDGNLKCYECSKCGKNQGYISNYCEDCGAEMKGGMEE